jgi:hypothetical protein
MTKPWYDALATRPRFAVINAADDDPQWEDLDYARRHLDKLMRKPNVGQKTVNEIRAFIEAMPTEPAVPMHDIEVRLDRIEALLQRALCLIA